MKTIAPLLICAAVFLSLGCDPPADAPDTPPAWVTYTGTEGLGEGKHVVLVSGDEEYRSEEMMPQLGKILAFRHGFTATVLFAQDPAHPGVIDPNYLANIPGLEVLASADLMVLFTRFRALPDDQMRHIEQYLLAGKPVIGIRTATHAFQYRDSTSTWLHWSNSHNVDGDPWDGGFGRLVLGERWHTHHGHHKQQSTRGLIAAGAKDHPIARGLADGDIWGPTDVYGVRLPMPAGVTPIVMGQTIDRTADFDEADPFFGLKPTDSAVASTNPAARTPYNPNDPMMPIAWTKPYQLPGGTEGMAFTSTIGSSTDFANAGVRRLLVNAAYHLVGLEVPAAAHVDLVGPYEPSAYNFHSDEYWEEKNLLVADQQMDALPR